MKIIRIEYALKLQKQLEGPFDFNHKRLHNGSILRIFDIIDVIESVEYSIQANDNKIQNKIQFNKGKTKLRFKSNENCRPKLGLLPAGDRRTVCASVFGLGRSLVVQASSDHVLKS